MKKNLFSKSEFIYRKSGYKSYNSSYCKIFISLDFFRIRILRLWLVRRTVRIPLPVRRRSSCVTRMMVSCPDLRLRRNRSSIRLRRDQQYQSQESENPNLWKIAGERFFFNISCKIINQFFHILSMINLLVSTKLVKFFFNELTPDFILQCKFKI